MKSNAAGDLESQKPDVLWFVARGHVLKGPFSTEEVCNRVRKKEVSFLDYCWRQGFREWRPIGSIEDFDRRGRLRALPEYPTIPVPGGGSIRAPETHSVPPSASPSHASHPHHEKQKRFQVTLARSRRHSITIYEWGFAAIFSLVFAYFSAHFALTEVENAVMAKLSLLRAGIQVDLSQEGGDSISPKFWEPLFSAPSYSDMASQSIYERVPGQPDLLDLTIRIGGIVQPSRKGEPTIGGYALAGMPAWASDRYLDPHVDPVYIRPREIVGRLPVRAPASIEVNAPGEPYLRH